MAETALIDHVRILQSVEEHGVTKRLVRLARVVNLDTDVDYNVLLTALAAAGVPVNDSELAEFPNLRLTGRSTDLVDRSTVDVTLVYDHFFNPGQSFDDPPAGLFAGAVRVNLSQVTSNLDIDGNVIEVEHTYPADDPDYKNQTFKQGGEITYLQPERTITLQGIKITERPWLIANAAVGTLNDDEWSGELTHTWLCTASTWEPHDQTGGANTYKMTFEFQHNLDGWNPSVVFIDDRTGKPPVDLVEDVGYKTVRKLKEGNFDDIIGTWIQGG